VGWWLAILGAVTFYPGVVGVMMYFGLLPAVTAMFITTVMGSVVSSLDFSAWYADRALVPMVVIAGILIYGAATALAGKGIFGDPLRDNAAR
jgi:hypothetical protein